MKSLTNGLLEVGYYKSSHMEALASLAICKNLGYGLCGGEACMHSHQTTRHDLQRILPKKCTWTALCVSFLGCNLLSCESITQWALNHFFCIPKSDVHLFQIYATVMCDLMWFSRNRAVHDGVFPNVLVLSTTIKKISLDHFKAWKDISSPCVERWSPPVGSSLKINFDTAIRDSFSAQGAVCRDSSGKILEAVSQIIPLCDPTYSEALAAALAISLAISLGCADFFLEGDSQVVIMALQHPSIVCDWKIVDIIFNSIATIPLISSWRAKKVHVSANFYTHHHVTYWTAARVYSNYIPTHLPHPLLILFVVAQTHLL
ncbi:uncharacterized protein LOC132163555 [Corylus avellana]|uniref:uncharacterized protein LOC132163555 n=1 Tax=Corylus avellana TaxID=13451 RepID=UPI00286A383C|nr:uncharacterized protein LOC132163555 [Corylus avellana]